MAGDIVLSKILSKVMPTIALVNSKLLGREQNSTELTILVKLLEVLETANPSCPPVHHNHQGLSNCQNVTSCI